LSNHRFKCVNVFLQCHAFNATASAPAPSTSNTCRECIVPKDEEQK
jgi:hypothetical protein